MNVSDIKLSNFENLVIKEAEEKRDVVLKELAKDKQQKLEEIEKEIRETEKQRLNKTISAVIKEKNEHIVQKQLMYKQEILSERQKLIDDVFENIKKRLNDFVNSADYSDYLLAKVSSSKENLQNASVVQISKNDEKYAEKISALGLTVDFIEEDIIGGCLLIDRSNGIRIDETFATKVKEAKDEFLETYNLKI